MSSETPPSGGAVFNLYTRSYVMNDAEIMLRVPRSLRSALEPIAQRQNRNWAQQARHVLERYIVQSQIKQTPQS